MSVATSPFGHVWSVHRLLCGGKGALVVDGEHEGRGHAAMAAMLPKHSALSAAADLAGEWFMRLEGGATSTFSETVPHLPLIAMDANAGASARLTQDDGHRGTATWGQSQPPSLILPPRPTEPPQSLLRHVKGKSAGAQNMTQDKTWPKGLVATETSSKPVCLWHSHSLPQMTRCEMCGMA